ncbi:50S ribosomal protein L3 [Spiroplasma platyhelix]|uniref:Large ribosomal subunit protein uL3 n=1 Tax=Spiroplasma platyhelix PALS-1 TaxID=1276218 RepID=A0A846TQN9_9MOLU|nr:50S ribosomal protein L3 [Spiroplasma platyhelix]MBE4704278.1 50S ribosomal protein L3 [Spiroplasma platyhelix PALS-1]NKE38650.1 50S ribosomal protein L3 [Spiroplasma platyhelix PALS-1]UJB28862.1 50S ribosomal protein L3 [Spiroplasma platyhelix PALS-1]
MKGILGKKLGMSQVFLSNGQLVPVTVIEIQPNLVSQVKTGENEKYNSLQLSTFDLRLNLTNKAVAGHFKKVDSQPKRFVKEIRNMAGFNVGDIINASDVFTAGEFVDVTGTSKGKGFQGRIKRFNQTRGPMGHGSGLHRQMGSTGSIAANRVFKNQPMPGQMGNAKRTISNLEIIKVEEKYILVKGSVPGPKKGFVVIKEAVKNPKTVAAANLHKWASAQSTENTSVASASVETE